LSTWTSLKEEQLNTLKHQHKELGQKFLV